MAHARGSSEGSQGCREDAHDDLNDGLPSFFLHSAFMFFCVLVTWGLSPLLRYARTASAGDEDHGVERIRAAITRKGAESEALCHP